MLEACQKAGKEVLPRKPRSARSRRNTSQQNRRVLLDGNKDTSGSPCGKTQHLSRHLSDHLPGAMIHDRARIVRLLRRRSNMRSHQ